MSEKIGSSNRFTKEMMDIAARLWARSSISLIDVRYRLIHPDHPMQNYRMPSSMLVFIHGGMASVELDHTVYHSERFGIFHGGKGTELSLHPISESLETYMVLYKAEAPSFYQREIHRLLEHANPFIQTYGFSPENPIFFMEKFLSLYDRWNEKSALDQFYAKVVLYQIVYEIYYELEKGDIRYVQPDYVGLVKQYLERHYSESVSIQQLIDRLPISRSQLMRLFKKREQRSFQEYLNEIRLDAAKRHLQHTKATIQEIAAGCGFADELNLQRMFKKYAQMTPSEYRIKMKAKRDVHDIDNDSHHPYNERELGRLVKSTGDGELTMFGKTRSKEMIVAAAMSLMLLLSACTSAAPANTGSPSSTPAQTQVQTTPNTAQTKGADNAAQTRIVKTENGDVEIPVHPERIISDYHFGAMVALGVKPIAVGYYSYTQYPLVKDYTSGIADLGSPVNFEKVVEMNPDLIVLWSDKDYEQWSRIAPTIIVPLEQDYTIRGNMRTFGDILGKQKEAEAWIADFDAKVATARQRIAGAIGPDETVSVIRLWDKGQVAYTNSMGANILFDEFKLKPAEMTRKLIEKGEGAANVSLELLDQYAGDHIFLVIDPGSEDAARSIMESPIWTNIPAVQQGRVYPIDFETFHENDPLSAMQQVDLLADLIVSNKK